MPGAERPSDAGLIGQREKAPCGRDAAAADHYCAVVQRRPRPEDRDEQVARDDRVERRSALDVFTQSEVALDRDQRADLATRQRKRRRHDFSHDWRLAPEEPAQHRRFAEPQEEPPDLRLEKHHDQQQEGQQVLTQDVLDAVQPELVHKEKDDDQRHDDKEEEATQHPRAASALKEPQDRVEDAEQQQNLDGGWPNGTPGRQDKLTVQFHALPRIAAMTLTT